MYIHNSCIFRDPLHLKRELKTTYGPKRETYTKLTLNKTAEISNYMPQHTTVPTHHFEDSHTRMYIYTHPATILSEYSPEYCMSNTYMSLPMGYEPFVGKRLVPL